MKALLRSLSGFLLAAMLVTFTLWRNESMPDLSGINSVLQDAMGQMSDLESLINGEKTPSDGDGSQDSAPKGPYVAFDPVTGVSAELESALLTAVTEHREELDVSSFGAESENFKTAMTQFFFTHPELFYVATSYKISSKQGSNVVSKITFEYLYDAAEVPAMKQTYEQELQKIVASVPADGSDFDKVLYLHDYFVQNYAYDYTGFRAEQQGQSGVAIRDTYRFFTQKTGVCQAYMLALIATANEVGIECLPVISDGMNHAWNLIKLDGEWYHIDVTWDDAGGEEGAVYPSYISYSYFLLSGEALYNTGRTQPWEAMQQADSTTYDEVIWREASTPMLKYNGSYYCTLYVRSQMGAGGYSAICGGSTPTEMAVLKDLNGIYWHPEGSLSSQYVRCFASIVVHEGRLIFNSGNGFYTFDPGNKMVRLIWDMSLTLGNNQIFGICGVFDGVITYVCAPDASGTYTEQTWEIQNLS